MPKKLRGGLKQYTQNQKIRRASAISKIVSLINFDMPNEDIKKIITEEYDIKDSTYDSYHAEAVKRMKGYREKTMKDKVDKNLDRMEALINECYEAGDLDKVMKAIDTLNKMIGAYEQKIKVDIDNDEPFQIKIE